ncbi:MAG TPA: RagB/SusD family nutrient uptake outer membrane protein [Puia sp.]|nr:RagB/SusD family nutrient uptake outer membrane protein [Puia sp.]
MNSKYLIFFMFPALLSVPGCTKLTEDPKGSLTPETYFKTQADLDAAVAAIFQGQVVDGGYAFDFPMYSYFGGDDLTTDPQLGKGDQLSFDELNGSSGNGSLANSVWGTPWAAIYQCNNVTDNYQRVTGDLATRNASAAQAFFVRAWSYFVLVRTFGPVPVITTKVSADYRPPRDSIVKVYAQIVSDLKTAIGLLPTYSGTVQPSGHATQNAARSLLAQVYLHMATWPLNQTSNYALAASEADSVILSGQYNLMPDYGQVFTTNDNSESIFALHFNVAGGNPDRLYGDCSGAWDENGLDGNFGWEEFFPEITYFNNAPPCKRTNEEFYTTLKLVQPNGTFLLVPYTSPLLKYANQHPFYRKYRAGLVKNGVAEGIYETDSAIISMNPSTNKTQDVLRYPLVLLTYAEASDMAGGGPTAGGYAAINLVRARAGEAPLTGGLSQTAFRDSVVYERAYEFGAEMGTRWFDIFRLQLLPKIVAARSPLEPPISPTNLAIIQDKYYAPIPVNEMLKNPQWTQNPGY